MKMPKELESHQANYKQGVWANYTDEEYMWWVRLYTQRATHRSNPVKRMKDLIDARNYLLMWIAKEED